MRPNMARMYLKGDLRYWIVLRIVEGEEDDGG